MGGHNGHFSAVVPIIAGLSLATCVVLTFKVYISFSRGLGAAHSMTRSREDIRVAASRAHIIDM
jgi:hypothetical protein